MFATYCTVLARRTSGSNARTRCPRRRLRPVLAELEPRFVLSQAPLTPPEIAQVYGFDQIKLPGGYPADGRGQTIAIIELGHTPLSLIQSCVSAFDAGTGLGYTLPPVPQLAEVNLGSQQSAGADQETETLLDVEWSHALA
ncbi:MAG: hypothetical protein ACLQVF_21160, partial [Isosphaeraceae bacterium]